MCDAMELNRALAQAAADTRRAETLRAQIASLDCQLAELRRQEAELARRRADEQADVDALEGHGLTALFYAALGRREDKLDKEKAEAYEAAARHDAARALLQDAEADRARRAEELSRLGDVARRYQAAYQAKLDWMRASDPAAAPELTRLEGERAQVKAERKELNEAIRAGQIAEGAARAALDQLSSAESWGTWDLIGGGLITDVVKHSKLDGAQQEIYRMQSALSDFRTELADVDGIDADLHVTIDGFLHFADFFFDGLLADWMVLDRISESRGRVMHTSSSISSVLSRLQRLDREAAEREQTIQKAIDALVEAR